MASGGNIDWRWPAAQRYCRYIVAGLWRSWRPVAANVLAGWRNAGANANGPAPGPATWLAAAAAAAADQRLMAAAAKDCGNDGQDYA